MTLYGLDVLIDESGQFFLNEINGVCSGMNGFKKIYGDNRVQDKVFDMLEDKYGLITINDGSHDWFYRKRKLTSLPVIRVLNAFFCLLRDPLTRKIIKSEKADIDWLAEEALRPGSLEFSQDIYLGQKSTVFNMVNANIEHPTINSFVAEEITRNKFLQYQVIKDSEISEHVIKSTLVGLGITDEVDLEEMLEQDSHFVAKPILGSLGKGIKFMSRDDVLEKYKNTRGPIVQPSRLKSLNLLLSDKESDLNYVEDLVQHDIYTFEVALSVLQPFIETSNNSEYSSIRAIVCNGEFVDAYNRVSSSKRVNLSHDANAVEFNYSSEFANLCEKIVDVYQRETEKYNLENFRKELYSQFFDERGWTSVYERLNDSSSNIFSLLFEGTNAFLDK